MTENETTETEWAELSSEALRAMTVAQLREIVDGVGIDVPKSAPKATLVEAIEDRKRFVAEQVARAVAETPEEIEGEATAAVDEPVAEDVAEAESTALALREEPVVAVPALLPSEAEFDAMLAIAGRIAGTQMVPLAYRGKPDDVLAAILTGREMGLGPMQSLRDIYVVDGKPSLSANLLLARLREGGVIILDSVCDNERAWIKARRRDTGETAEVEWTYEDAAKITYRKKGGATGKLVEKDNWVNYRSDMLWARCVGRLSRRLGSDLIGAAMPYTSEEVQDWDDGPADPGDRAPYGSDQRTGQWVGPKDWAELSKRIVGQLGGDAEAWMEELAEKAYRMPSLAAVVQAQESEVSADRKRDLWRRLNVVLRGLEETDRPVEGVGLALMPGVREIVQRIVAEAFDRTLALDGPAWALDPEEAATRPNRDGTPPAVGADLPAESESVADPSPETQENASGAEDAPSAPSGDDIDQIPF